MIPVAGSTVKLVIRSGRLMRHILDVHAAFGRNNESDAACGPIDQQGQIEFLDDRGAFFEIYPVDLLAGGAGLHGDEGAPEHLANIGLDLGHGFGEPDAALAARLRLLELALAAPARMDLGLHDPDRTAQLLRAAVTASTVRSTGIPRETGTPNSLRTAFA